MPEDLEGAALPWWHDDPKRLEDERAAMFAVAPDLIWRFEGSGGWVGTVPTWPMPRPQPKGIVALVDGRPFNVRISCSPAHPMIEPLVWPKNIALPTLALGLTQWHLLPSGTLCLLQDHTSWNPSDLISELIPKISGWYIEYHLKTKDLIDRMTEQGIAVDDSLDSLLNDSDALQNPGDQKAQKVI